METIIKTKYLFREHTTECEICNFSTTPSFTVLYIHGLQDNPWSRKAENIKAFCKENSLNFQRYELLGHGLDSKNFDDCDFETWKAQLCDIIEHHITGPIIIVGHSVGGWLGMCMTEKYPKKIKGFLSLAVAPDLIDQMIARATNEQRQTLADTGKVETTLGRFHYVFSQRLWTSLNLNNLLQQEIINISCPTHLIHGQQDSFVSWESALKIAKKIKNPQVVTKLIKSSNHHLQDQFAITETRNSLDDILRAAQSKGG